MDINRYNNKWMFAVCIFYAAQVSYAQKASVELAKVRQAYLDAENFSANVSVTGYTDKKDKTGTFIGKGMFRKAKNKYYSKFENEEMITNGNHTVIISHSEKNILWMDAEKTSSIQKKQRLPDVDSLLAMNDSVVHKGLKDGLNAFVFYNQRSPVYKTDLLVDAKTFFIKKLVYYYREINEEESYDMDHVVIEYKNISLQKPDEASFSDSKYIVKGKGKPALTDAYKKYKLIVIENEKI